MSRSYTVLVTGATGKQGGSVAKALLDRGHTVRALTRRLESAEAQQLRGKGAQLIGGSFDDPAGVVSAARGADAAFLMGNYEERGPEVEARYGIIGADALNEARVGHVIYASVAGANRESGVPHFESKLRVEKHLAKLGIPYTISAPAAFMENAIAPWAIGALRGGKQTFALPADRLVQLVAVADIGAFVATLIERRESVFGKRFEIAADELSSTQQAAVLSKAIGRPIEYQEMPLEALRQWNGDQALMADWLNRVGYDVDIAGLRREFPEVDWHSFERWAAEVSWDEVMLKSSGSADW